MQGADSGVYYKEFSSAVSGENTLIQAQKSDFSSNYAGFSMPSPKYMIIITWNKMELSKNPRANAEVRYLENGMYNLITSIWGLKKLVVLHKKKSDDTKKL